MRLALLATLLSVSFAASADHAQDGALALQQKDFARAAKEYQSATREAPKEAANWVQLALARQLQNDFAGSIAAYESAFALGKQAPNVVYNAACAFARAGKKDRALALLEGIAGRPVASAAQLKADDDLASLREEPRFATLLVATETLAHPCAKVAHARELDFWIGEWMVRDATGQQLGRSTVQAALDGCVILESWTDAEGGSGKSLHHVNLATGEWRQTRVDSKGIELDYRGTLQNGALVFIEDSGARTRMSIAPEGDDVRQLFETSPDGKTWSKAFDLLYVLREPRLAAVSISVEEVVAKSLAARGGAERLRAVKSERLTGKLSLNGGGGPLAVEMKRPGKMREQVTLQGKTTVRTTDGRKGFASNGTGPSRSLEKDELRNLAGSADFDGPLLDAQAKGNLLELLGKTKVAGKEAYKLRVTLKDGQVRFDFIDCASFLEVKWEGSVLLQGKEVTFETFFRDYREVSGVKVARLLDSGSPGGPQTQQIVFEKVEIDPVLDDRRFQDPGKP